MFVARLDGLDVAVASTALLSAAAAAKYLHTKSRMAELRGASEWLQSREQRLERKWLLDMWADAKDSDTTDDLIDEPDYRRLAEEVGTTFQSASFYANHGPLSRQLLLENWGPTLARCWEAVGPYVRERRSAEGNPELWADFEAVVGEQRGKLRT
jgi:hypothetical protein